MLTESRFYKGSNITKQFLKNVDTIHVTCNSANGVYVKYFVAGFKDYVLYV